MFIFINFLFERHVNRWRSKYFGKFRKPVLGLPSQVSTACGYGKTNPSQ